MENNFNNNDFEKFINKELEGLDENAQDNTWEMIAARQRKPNMWLKTKYYGTVVAPFVAIALVALFAMRQFSTSSQNEEYTTNTTQNNGTNAIVIPIDAIQPTEIAPIETINTTAAEHNKFEVAPGNTGINEYPKWYSKNKVPVAQIRFEAEKGVEYRNPESGNVVTIGGNTLVYADGSPVKGMVDMYFREYRSIPDMLASDVPMHYNDDRGSFFFNSGGMFDVRVSQLGKELFMAPGEAYQVDFTAKDNLSNASLFYLDEKDNNWDFVSEKPFLQDAPKSRLAALNTFDARSLNGNTNVNLPPISREEDVIRENTDHKKGETCLPYAPNFNTSKPTSSWVTETISPPVPNANTPKDAVGWVKEAVNTGLDLAYGKRTLPRWYCKNPTGTDAYFTNSMDRSEIKLVFANDEEMRFFPQDINNTFTELNAFKDCYFIRSSDSLPLSSNHANIEQIFNKTNIWRSFTILQDEAGKPGCTITLGTERDGFIRIRAKLVRSFESGIIDAKDAQSIYSKYWELREKRLNGMLAELQSLRRFTETSKMFYAEEERCFTEKEWLQYFEKNPPIMRARYSALAQKGMNSNDHLIKQEIESWATMVRDQKIALADRIAAKMSSGQQLTAMLSLMSFGTYNCDQIYQLTKTPMYSAAKYISTTGQVIVARNLRLLEKNSRLFLSMKDPEKICILPGRALDVLLTDVVGRTFHMTSADYNKVIAKERGTYTLTMTDVTETMKSPSDWASLLGI